MLTLIIVFLSIFIIRENEKYKNQKGMASLILVLILTIDACSIQTLYNNIIIVDIARRYIGKGLEAHAPPFSPSSAVVKLVVRSV